MSQLLNGTAVSFVYDKCSAFLSISTHLVAHLQLSVDCGSCSACVSVPTVDSVFTSVLWFVVTPDLECDAVLRLDWIGLCRMVMIDGLTVFPSSSVESTQYVRPNLSSSMSDFHLI
jgi:hypothetical protein